LFCSGYAHDEGARDDHGPRTRSTDVIPRAEMTYPEVWLREPYCRVA
jgi:hypothetical protein